MPFEYAIRLFKYLETFIRKVLSVRMYVHVICVCTSSNAPLCMYVCVCVCMCVCMCFSKIKIQHKKLNKGRMCGVLCAMCVVPVITALQTNHFESSISAHITLSAHTHTTTTPQTKGTHTRHTHTHRTVTHITQTYVMHIQPPIN